MSLPFLSICTCVPCAVQIRALGAYLESGGDTTNMLAWVNDPANMDTVAWNSYYRGVFTDPSQTSPPTFTSAGSEAGFCDPTNQLLIAAGVADGDGNCTTMAAPVPFVQRAQIILPLPTAYFVIAYGNTMEPSGGMCPGNGGGNWFALGCIYPQQGSDQYPMTVDLPIPDNTLDDSVLVQGYVFGLIDPAVTYVGGNNIPNAPPIVLPDLASLTVSSAGAPGFGANWAASVSNPCYDPVDDPFSGSDPP